MIPIVDNTNKFILALYQQQSIIIDANQREWQCPKEGILRRICRICESSESRLVSTAKQLTQLFDNLEKKAVVFNCKEAMQSQQKVFTDCRTIANAMIRQLEKCHSAHSKQVLDSLLEKVISLRYRITSAYEGGLEKGDQNAFSAEMQELYSSLQEKAKEWKKKQPLFVDDPNLNESDYVKLKELSVHPEYAELVLANHKLQERCFKWCLRDKNPVDVLVQYSGTAEILTRSFISNCTNHFQQEDLALDLVNRATSPGQEKVLTLPFEGRKVSILDDRQLVHFNKGNWTVTIADVFRDCAEQNTVVPQFIYLPGQGFWNWNRHLHGYYDADQKKTLLIDLEIEKWWEQIPAIHISREKAKKYFDCNIKKQDGVVAICATRVLQNLDPADSHGFTKIALPTENGGIKFYSFGTFAHSDDWPKNKCEQVSSIGGTSKAVLSIYDANVNYTQRQHTHVSIVDDSSSVEQFLNTFKNDIRAARAGNQVFQPPGNNCSYSSQDKVTSFFKEKLKKLDPQGNIPNFFRIPFNEIDGLFKPVIKWVKMFPTFFQPTVMRFLFRFLWPSRGFWVEEGGKKVWKSMTYSKFWEDFEIYLPSALFEYLKKGKVKKVYVLNSG